MKRRTNVSDAHSLPHVSIPSTPSFQSNRCIVVVYGESTLNLRGGGSSDRAVISEALKREPEKYTGGAVQEISPEGYEMDFVWDDPESVNTDVEEETLPPLQEIRLYGWQGAMNTSFRYTEFVAQVDRLIGNRHRVDQSVCLEIWRVSPVQFEEGVTGPIYHSEPDAPAGDPIWHLLRKYSKPGSVDKYACFVRRGDEKDSTDKSRPGGYQPSSADRYVVRIENQNRGEVAYMRVPSNLYPEHKPHQFSKEYTDAMQLLLLPGAPHALVSYQQGLIGDTYQDLDPPGGLWDQVIEAQREWSSLPTISFRLMSLGNEVVPVLIPGVFASAEQPELSREDFEFTNSSQDGSGLSKLYKIIESSAGGVGLKKECSGFEIWCSGPKFKHTTQQPTRIRFSGNITNVASLEDWRGFLAGAVPNEPFCLVVRPVYKAYRLRTLDNNGQVDIQINQYSLEEFRAFVHNRFHEDYNPHDAAQVISLRPVSQESYQPELTIRQDTTEEEWQWIRRNIIEPELIVSVEDLGNEWRKYSRYLLPPSP